MQSAVEQGKLMIPVAKVMDSGDYTCRVVGISGNFQATARLEVVASKISFIYSEFCNYQLNNFKLKVKLLKLLELCHTEALLQPVTQKFKDINTKLA